MTLKERQAVSEAKIEVMEKRQDQMFDVLKEIKSGVDENKGARRALHTLYVVGASILAFKFGDITALFGK